MFRGQQMQNNGRTPTMIGMFLRESHKAFGAQKAHHAPGGSIGKLPTPAHQQNVLAFSAWKGHSATHAPNGPQLSSVRR